jgi:hypothetical protein
LSLRILATYSSPIGCVIIKAISRFFEKSRSYCLQLCSRSSAIHWAEAPLNIAATYLPFGV